MGRLRRLPRILLNAALTCLFVTGCQPAPPSSARQPAPASLSPSDGAATRPASRPVAPWYAGLEPWPTPPAPPDETGEAFLAIETAEQSVLGEHGIHNTRFDPAFTREAAFRVLLTTDLFAGETVGSVGHTSYQAWAFRALLRQPDAAAAFADLVDRAKWAGRLYGLCGLYLLDRRAFDSATARFRRAPEGVWTMAYDFYRYCPVAPLMDEGPPWPSPWRSWADGLAGRR